MRGPGVHILLLTRAPDSAQRLHLPLCAAVGEDAVVETAAPGNPASEAACDLIFLDAASVPEWQDLLRRRIGGPPAIVVSAGEMAEAFEAGAVDCIDEAELSAPILRHALLRARADAQATLSGIGKLAFEKAASGRKPVLTLLRQNEELYRTLVEATGETFAIIDESGVFHFINAVAADRLGSTPADLLGKTMWDLFPRGLADRQMASIRKAIAHGKRETVEALTVVRGEYRWYRTSIEPISATPDMPAHALVFALDITEQRRAEEKLRQFKTITDRASYGAAIIDMEGRITYANEAWARMHGWEAPELVGRHLSVLHTDEQMARVRELLGRLLETGGFTAQEVGHVRKDGSAFPTLMNATLIQDQQGRPVLMSATAVDISERRRAEEALAEQRVKTIAAARLAALGVMAGGVAHEINNPLMVIAGSSEQLRAQLAQAGLDRPPFLEGLDRIARNVERIERIVRGLRNLCHDRPDTSHSVAFVDRILEDTLELCRSRLAGGNVRLEVESAPGPIAVECRAPQVSQVILNLLTNAQDAAEESAGKWVRVEVRDSHGAVEIGVSDSGSGVPPAIRERVFEPFFTTKPPGKGTGLGLSISRAIVEAHGGELWLDTACPRTRFVVRLPKRQAPHNEEKIDGVV